jgi:hypothetical protein
MFTVKIYAKNCLYPIIIQQFGGHTYWLDIDHVQINAEVNETVLQDIYLQDAIVNIPVMPAEDGRISVIAAPNPCRDETKFLINIPDDISYRNGSVLVYSAAGDVLRTLPFSGQRSFALTCSTNGLSGGSYIFSLNLDDQPRKTGHLLIVK